MILLSSIFTTPEFYVIVSVIAAAVIAYMSIPQQRGEARLHLLSGDLLSGVETESVPAITFTVRDNGRVELRRDGLEGISLSGAVSLAVKVIGFDVFIEERLTPGSGGEEASSAFFDIDFMAPEWYHIKYNSEATGRFAALSLHVRHGIVVRKELVR